MSFEDHIYNCLFRALMMQIVSMSRDRALNDAASRRHVANINTVAAQVRNYFRFILIAAPFRALLPKATWNKPVF